jgi:hypothetical protein
VHYKWLVSKPVTITTVTRNDAVKNLEKVPLFDKTFYASFIKEQKINFSRPIAVSERKKNELSLHVNSYISKINQLLLRKALFLTL